MQTTAKLYTDIDYESFPIADLDLDLHWIQLPNSVLAARRQAKLEALERARLAALPKDHKVNRAVSPCFSAFDRMRSFPMALPFAVPIAVPIAVTGPFDFAPFKRAAAICFSVLIMIPR